MSNRGIGVGEGPGVDVTTGRGDVFKGAERAGTYRATPEVSGTVIAAMTLMKRTRTALTARISAPDRMASRARSVSFAFHREYQRGRSLITHQRGTADTSCNPCR